ncbi:HP0495 family protein [Arcobacter sp.]|uniref:HP0495 family protein n=1 Tax=Arcobacter sp. TaxID=1872629 RepID=UPI003D131A35
MIDLSKHKLELDYPCSWSYKIVVTETVNIHEVIKEVIIEREHKVSESKVSSKGKFKSYTLDLIVHNEDDRKIIYELLGKHSLVKMVL